MSGHPGSKAGAGSALETLRARVASASGPDREIDRDLTEALYPEQATRTTRCYPGWLHPVHGRIRCERYTASIDAAMDLVERALPGAGWKLEPKWARIYTLDGHSGTGATPPLAILSAMLAALSSAEQTPEPAPGMPPKTPSQGQPQ